uniref:Apple domain-containing protein n=1 Tax=Mesocestoides corti TaxID=53468 RepID=A0A5K3EUG5_MESCO
MAVFHIIINYRRHSTFYFLSHTMSTFFLYYLSNSSCLKVFEKECVPRRTWESCLQKCLLLRIQRECGCTFLGSGNGCNLYSISNCSLPIDSLQDSLSPSTCNCIRPCEQITYAYESITQAWQPFFPGFKQFRHTQPRSWHNQSATDGQASSQWTRHWSQLPNLHESGRQFAASIQLWAFLREANRRVFHELVSLDKTLLSLYQISGVMQRVVKLIGDATTYSRRGGTRIIKNLFETKEKSGRFFDENCLDQAEHNGMLARVSQLSSAFTNQLQESFLFKPDKRNVQLNLVLIFLQRSPLDFTRLLNELRISDLISDVTVLDLRRNGQKCLDSAYSLNGLLSNFTTTYHFPLNSSEARANGAARANENIISSLQAMLLATDASLTKLSAEFSRLYNQNKLLINEMRSLLSYQSSVERRHCRVSVTVQLTSRQGQSLLLKSSESLMSKDAELLDILTSAVMIGSLVVLLAEGAFSAVWRCRLSPHSRASGDLKRRFTTPEFDRSRPPPPAPQSAHQDHSTGMPRLQRGSGRNVYGLPRDSVTPACTVKWNHFTLAPPHKFVGQIARHQQQHQRQLFLDITETSSGVINSPSTSAHPFSDVV